MWSFFVWLFVLFFASVELGKASVKTKHFKMGITWITLEATGNVVYFWTYECKKTEPRSILMMNMMIKVWGVIYIWRVVQLLVQAWVWFGEFVHNLFFGANLTNIWIYNLGPIPSWFPACTLTAVLSVNRSTFQFWEASKAVYCLNSLPMKRFPQKVWKVQQ